MLKQLQEYQLTGQEKQQLNVFYSFSMNPRKIAQITDIPLHTIQRYFESLDNTRNYVADQQKKRTELDEVNTKLEELKRVQANLLKQKAQVDTSIQQLANMQGNPMSLG